MKHLDAPLHTQGTSAYVDDVRPPAGMLYAAVLGSSVAHGRIQSLNLEAALATAGVVTVLTARDIPGENQIGPIFQDEPLLADTEVHFAGQPIALVVGTSLAVAQEGVRQIAVEVEKLPAITDPREAFAKGHLLGTPRTFVLGDIETAWGQCDVVVEGHCSTRGQEHLYLETQRARVIPLEDRTFRIYASTQSPFAVQKGVARILGVPYHAIEVDVKRLGGGFGGKEDQATPWSCLPALAAWHTQKPVELVLPRHDDLRMTGKRHPYASDFKIGATKEGKILAFQAKHYQNAGAAADLSTSVLERTLFHSTNAYFIPNVEVFAACCRTNIPPNTAFRGFGGPQGMFVIESAISQVAEALSLSREEVQRKNLIQSGDRFPYGQVAEAAHAVKTWDEAASHYDLTARQKQIQQHNARHATIKKGLAVMPVCFGISFTTTFMNQASSLVHVYTDGSVSITTGGVEMGQSLNTNIAKIASRAFGISPMRIKIESTNTTRIANMSPSAASATTDLNGNATRLAAAQIVDRLKAVAGAELNLEDQTQITVSDEQILYGGEATGWTWAQLVQKAYQARVALSAHAFYATPGIWFDKAKEKGHPFAYHAYGTAIVEVTLDTLRGIYDIDAVHIVHDLGRPVNELTDRGQIEGGLAQGLGWMTVEDLQYSEDGQLLSSALATYKVPDVYFSPKTVNIKLLEDVENPLGPYGSKAVGEPPLMYGIGAFFALRQAMRAFRPNQPLAFDAPLTPERVLLALYPEYVESLQPKTTPTDGRAAEKPTVVVDSTSE